MPTKLELQTTFAFNARPLPFELDTAKGVIIRVASDCVAQSSRIASDLNTALDYGALHAAHELMIDKIKQAEGQQKPLICTLEYGL